MLRIDGATLLRLPLKPLGVVALRILWQQETEIRPKEVLLMYAEMYRHM